MAIRTSFESKPGPEFILFVDDGDRFVSVSLAEAVDSDCDPTLFVFDDEVDPFTEFHTRFGLGKRGAARNFDSMASPFELTKANNVVADLKTGSDRCEFFCLEPVTQMTHKRFRNSIEVDDRFQSKVMIAFERFHRILSSRARSEASFLPSP